VLASVQAKVAAAEALAADSVAVVATLDDARARKEAARAKLCRPTRRKRSGAPARSR
jgi:hypothetical protein